MTENLKELVRFYAQKYHVPVHMALDRYGIDLWDRNSILVAMPERSGQAKFVSDLILCQDEAFARHLGGNPVLLDDLVLGRQGTKHLVFCFHPMNDASQAYARQLVESHLPKLARSFRKQLKDDLLERLGSCVHDRKRELQSSIREDGYEVERLSLQLMQLSRKLETDRQVLRMFEQPGPWIRHRTAHTFVDLMKLVPGIYRGFRLENDSLIGQTHEITLSYDGSDYKFEPYDVQVNLRQGKVFISGGTNVNGYIHPHVTDEPSGICWGNIGHLVSRMAGELDLFGLFQLIYQFLSSYNPNDPYQRIERWDSDWEEESSDEDEPYCSYCDDYGHTIGDCDSCWWCDHCNEYVDHEEANCPNRPKPEPEEEEHASELAEA